MNELQALQELYDVRGRVILITGACGYFGKHITRLFLRLGAKVILLSRSDRLREQTNDLQIVFGDDSVSSYQVDFYEREKFQDKLQYISVNKHIDVIINNAYDISERTGFDSDTGAIEKLSYREWFSAFQCTYWAVQTIQIIGSTLKDQQCGSIINIGSMYGVIAPDPKLYEGEKYFNPATYSTNKAALIGLTRYVAAFWGKYRVRCNAILPGPFPNSEKVKPNSDFDIKLKERTAIKRVGMLSDLDGLLVYLACDASAFMTGQIIGLDGGWTII